MTKNEFIQRSVISISGGIYACPDDISFNDNAALDYSEKQYRILVEKGYTFDNELTEEDYIKAFNKTISVLKIDNTPDYANSLFNKFINEIKNK